MNDSECRITINGEREIVTQTGGTLLSALAERKVFLPSACGGRGLCGKCKVKVDFGGGAVTAAEERRLPMEERAEGMRLACQVKIDQDASIEIPEAMLKTLEYRARVERVTDLTYDTKEIRLALSDPRKISFRAGQYIQLRTPVYEGNKEQVYRAYSISSSPSDPGAVETVIRLVPNGICTTWVFRHMKVGDEVYFNGPFGEFGLRRTSARVVMVAGASGISAIKSLIEAHGPELGRRGCRFFFGARALKDLFHVELMRGYEEKYPGFKFIPALSQPEPDDKWEGERGLITDVVDRNVAAGENAEFYLCGSPGMIEACLRVLRVKGVKDEAIFYDKFA